MDLFHSYRPLVKISCGHSEIPGFPDQLFRIPAALFVAYIFRSLFSYRPTGEFCLPGWLACWGLHLIKIHNELAEQLILPAVLFFVADPGISGPAGKLDFRSFFPAGYIFPQIIFTTGL